MVTSPIGPLFPVSVTPVAVVAVHNRTEPENTGLHSEAIKLPIEKIMYIERVTRKSATAAALRNHFANRAANTALI
jgi:hypothetical protein